MVPRLIHLFNNNEAQMNDKVFSLAQIYMTLCFMLVAGSLLGLGVGLQQCPNSQTRQQVQP